MSSSQGKSQMQECWSVGILRPRSICICWRICMCICNLRCICIWRCIFIWMCICIWRPIVLCIKLIAAPSAASAKPIKHLLSFPLAAPAGKTCKCTQLAASVVPFIFFWLDFIHLCPQEIDCIGCQLQSVHLSPLADLARQISHLLCSWHIDLAYFPWCVLFICLLTKQI